MFVVLKSSLSVSASVSVSPSLSMSLSVCVCVSLCLSVCLYMSVCLSVYLFACLCVSVSLCVSVCLSVCLSVSLLILLKKEKQLALFFFCQCLFGGMDPASRHCIVGWSRPMTHRLSFCSLQGRINCRFFRIKPRLEFAFLHKPLMCVVHFKSALRRCRGMD